MAPKPSILDLEQALEAFEAATVEGDTPATGGAYVTWDSPDGAWDRDPPAGPPAGPLRFDEGTFDAQPMTPAPADDEEGAQ